MRSKLGARATAGRLLAWLTSSAEVRRSTKAHASAQIFTRSPTGDLTGALHGAELTRPGLGLAPDSTQRTVLAWEASEATPLEPAWAASWDYGRPDGRGPGSLAHTLSAILERHPASVLYHHALHHLLGSSEPAYDEEKIVNRGTGIRESVVWQKLYKFQRDGVIGVIEKLERHGGCILADSVGLGKTFEALAVIKYHELRNERVLVLCPKRLAQNWTQYNQNNGNVLDSDRLRYDVLFHTDLSRERGSTGAIDIERVNWGNYDLVVIDESHNFRNKKTPKKGGETRYDKLLKRVIREGVKTKVLMLSATPVNNRLADLRNQIAFATADRDDALHDAGTVHEYILVYAKRIDALGELYVPQSQASIDRYYTKTDANSAVRGPYRTHPLEATKSMGDRPNLVFPIAAPDGAQAKPKRQWLWSKERVESALAKGELEFLRDKSGNWTVHSKQYLKDSDGEVRKAKTFSIIEGVYSQHGTNELLELFGDAHIFPFPKPIGLLRPLLEFGATDPDCIVLDFFAGSGSFGHATMCQNQADGVGRRYILVQLPAQLDIGESNEVAAAKLCNELKVPRSLAEVTKERLRRARRGLLDETPAGCDHGFRVFRLAASNLRKWTSSPSDLGQALLAHTTTILDSATDDDLATEVLLKLGFELTHPCEIRRIAGKTVRAYSGVLYLCFDAFADEDVDAFVDQLGALHQELTGGHPTPSTVIFRDDRLGRDSTKTNLAAGLEHRGLGTIRSL